MVRLAKTAGIQTIDFKDKFTAIKMHFGEEGNLSFLRADYARELASLIKELGGNPFVTDCSTLYVGSRKNALDHLDVAFAHGYNPLSLGCHTIIADGLKGHDDVEIPINGEYVKFAKIGRAIVESDVFISLTHFKGHEHAGFGGALKNIGMGGGSSRGKAEMHMDEKPCVNPDTCVGCGVCSQNCAHEGVSVKNGLARVDYENCLGCGRCISVCPTGAMHTIKGNSAELLSRRIAEYSWAICKDKPNFHISLVIDVSPCCDCCSFNDAPIVPNVGMFASFDPVALDRACADMVNKQTPIADSQLGECMHRSDGDHFHTMFPNSHWMAAIEQGEKLGLGSSEYELITVE